MTIDEFYKNIGYKPPDTYKGLECPNCWKYGVIIDNDLTIVKWTKHG